MLDRKLIALLEMAPAYFDAFASDPKNVPRLRELVEELEAVATGAARLAAYLCEREGYGCGDQGHARAVRASNSAAAKVRKAFGYNVTHPINF